MIAAGDERRRVSCGCSGISKLARGILAPTVQAVIGLSRAHVACTQRNTFPIGRRSRLAGRGRLVERLCVTDLSACTGPPTEQPIGGGDSTGG